MLSFISSPVACLSKLGYPRVFVVLGHHRDIPGITGDQSDPNTSFTQVHSVDLANLQFKVSFRQSYPSVATALVWRMDCEIHTPSSGFPLGQSTRIWLPLCLEFIGFTRMQYLFKPELKTKMSQVWKETQCFRLKLFKPPPGRELKHGI